MSETLGKKCSWRTFDSELVAKRRFKSTCFFCGAVMCSSHSLYGNIHVQFWDGKCFRLHHRNSQKGAKIIYTAISFLHLILFCPTDWLNRKKTTKKGRLYTFWAFSWHFIHLAEVMLLHINRDLTTHTFVENYSWTMTMCLDSCCLLGEKSGKHAR